MKRLKAAVVVLALALLQAREPWSFRLREHWVLVAPVLHGTPTHMPVIGILPAWRLRKGLQLQAECRSGYQHQLILG